MVSVAVLFLLRDDRRRPVITECAKEGREVDAVLVVVGGDDAAGIQPDGWLADGWLVHEKMTVVALGRSQ